MGAIRRFFALDAAQRTLVLRAFGIVVRSSATVHLFPANHVIHVLEHQRWTIASHSHHSVEQITWAIAAVSRHVPGSSCLVQAIALSRLMYANGYECQIDIGVMKSLDRKFAAHAWIRYEGKVILGGDPREYKLLATFPQDREA